MKVYITRHGETLWNQEGKMQGWKNSNLSLKGIENAKKLGQHLKDIRFDAVYCSSLGRAQETAAHIIGDKPLVITYCDDLKEMNFGKWEGMRHTDIDLLYAEQRNNFWNNPLHYKSIEGENFSDLLARAEIFIEKLKQLKDVENVLIVSHAIYIKALYSVIKGYTVNEFWNPPFIKDTSLTILNIQDSKIEIELEADTSHLFL
ncbi:MAG: histidine phosphatase family protein [Clostridiales bacterium]|jgi:broad specificity phosphatase PhoE|nr:histidine phosphatase family protein [Clostridiales bacterium]MDU6976078.1 histidine phosphatase family protein [Clostridiales bacterium]